MVGGDIYEKYFQFTYDSLKIGNTVERLEDMSLTCFGSTPVQIPDSVSAISQYCFNYSGAILVGIPKSVIEIGENAFLDI